MFEAQAVTRWRNARLGEKMPILTFKIPKDKLTADMFQFYKPSGIDNGYLAEADLKDNKQEDEPEPDKLPAQEEVSGTGDKAVEDIPSGSA